MKHEDVGTEPPPEFEEGGGGNWIEGNIFYLEKNNFILISTKLYALTKSNLLKIATCQRVTKQQ